MQISVINKKNVDQEDLIYLAVPLGIMDRRAGTMFTDASANTDIPPKFYSASESINLNSLNWRVIQSPQWSYSEGERHQKMAELLVPDFVAITEISHIVTWNDEAAESVAQHFDKNRIPRPLIETNNHHYFQDFKNGDISIITGPRKLNQLFRETVDFVINNKSWKPKFPSPEKALEAIRSNFASIKELAEIDGLAANYGPHSDDVGTHSRRVATLVREASEYKELSAIDQITLELAAYFHDIGKGPKSRWENSHMNKSDNDHAKKSLPMLRRILTEDIGSLSNDSIRKLIMLVTYDDLLGDIAAKGRDPQQFFNLITSASDIKMLVALSQADIGAISSRWLSDTSTAISQLKAEALQRFQGTS